MVLEALLELLSEHVQVEEIQEFGCEAINHIAEKCKGDVKRKYSAMATANKSKKCCRSKKECRCGHSTF